jgi:NAD(P)-dependent dehydrogenase (short-subunit alcohol dehydrogenase family)
MACYLIIGADRGIGLSISKMLAGRGDDVISVCLNDGKAYAGTKVKVIPNIDVTSEGAVANMAGALRKMDARIDVVIHVAGVLGLDELGKIDYADVRRQFEINTIGPLRAVEALLPFLSQGSKVGVITSRVGSLSDNGSGGMYAYRLSKAGANMVVLNLHHDLSKQGVAVCALHPGAVATDLTKGYPGNYNYTTPDEAATGLIARMDELTLESSGGFWHANGTKLNW